MTSEPNLLQLKLCGLFNDSTPSARDFKPPRRLHSTLSLFRDIPSGYPAIKRRKKGIYPLFFDCSRRIDLETPRGTGSTTSSRRRAGKTRLLLAPQDEKDLSPTTGCRQIFSVRRFRHRRDHLLLRSCPHSYVFTTLEPGTPFQKYVRRRDDDTKCTKCTKSSAFG